MGPRAIEIAVDNDARPSARVATVARILECDESQVRRLVQDGKLEAHGLGKRGIRVYLDSVAAYQGGRPVQPRPAKKHADSLDPGPAQASSAAYRAALARLRQRGLV